VAPAPEQHRRAVSGSERLYRALLAAYPKEFRRAYGREMAQVLRCMCREELVSGGRGGSRDCGFARSSQMPRRGILRTSPCARSRKFRTALALCSKASYVECRRCVARRT